MSGGLDWRSFGKWHTKLYQRWGGRFVGSLGGGRKVLLLTTTGRKSGLPRTAPLVYMPYGDTVIVYASNGGKENPPAWWLNLQSDAAASIQIGRDVRAVRARAASEAEYAEIWPLADTYNRHWRGYQAKTERFIPLVILDKA